MQYRHNKPPGFSVVHVGEEVLLLGVLILTIVCDIRIPEPDHTPGSSHIRNDHTGSSAQRDEMAGANFRYQLATAKRASQFKF